MTMYRPSFLLIHRRSFLYFCCAMIVGVCAQNYVNVAPSKNYSQSSIYHTQKSSSMAANDDTRSDQTFDFPSNCIHTVGYKYAYQWWEVDLGRAYPVYTIDVWARYRFKHRLHPSIITVDGQACASITSFPTDTREKTVTCSSVMYGRTVRITLQKTYRPLNLCEMQIWVPSEVSQCEAGKYGTSCNMNCNELCGKGLGKNFCFQTTGYCYDGCVSGWYGDQCSTACSPGCQNTTCGRQSGQCSPCKSHYTGFSCSECQDGYCKETQTGRCVQCSANCLSGTCDRQTGKCNGCVAGWYGDQCNTHCSPGCLYSPCGQQGGQCYPCKTGYTGDSCSECMDGHYSLTGSCVKCSSTCQSGSCNKQTGRCHGCVDGHYGAFCYSVCRTSRCRQCDQDTGLDCTQCALNTNLQPPYCTDCVDGYHKRSDNTGCDACRGTCQSGTVCDKTTGFCPLCPPGKQGHYCEHDCQNNRYGQDCAESCGQCRGGQTCDPVTGHCSDGCQPGWTDLTRSDVHLCQSECADGFYGEGCKQTCGNCQVSSECRRDTGQCTGQCADGFTGLYCADALTDDGNNTATIAGAVVAAVIVIAIAVFIVVFMMRRRKRAAKSNTLVAESSEMSGSVQDVADRGEPGSQRSSTLSLEPVVSSVGDKTNSKPTVEVKPVAKQTGKASPQPTKGHIYENVPLSQRNTASKPTPARSQQTGEQNGAAREVQRGSPPEGTARPLPRAEKSHGACRVPLTDDEELDSIWSGEAIYANDPSLVVFQPTTVRLDQLQKTIVDNLQDGKVIEEFGRLTGLKEYPLSNGQSQDNYYKNRFMSILPYDKTRVVLEQLDGDDASDYINASFIKGYKTEKAYIAAQGPKSNTQDDFWRLVWQEGVTDIVMLTNLKEGTKPKCHGYWPEKGTSLTTGHVEVTGLEEEERAHFIIRMFSVRNLQNQEQRQVRQYHYIKWMDHEVPSTTPLVNFWRYVRARAPRTPTAPPLLVHCSAGVGRTGTYIALDILIDQTQEQEEISLYHTVDNLREYRCHMVQNKSQYEFLHEAVLEAYMSGDCRLQTSSFDHVFPSPIHHDQSHPRIDAEFRRLCQMRTCLTRPTHTVASMEENRHKNRNPDALPDDNHLVYITEHTKGGNQYINAVYLPTFLSSRGSIVTQLPLADTVIDLWRLVDSWNVSTIVSIGHVDGDKVVYWPRTKGHPVKCGVYTVNLKSMNPLGDTLDSYTVDMKKQNQSRDLRVLHYEAWTGQVADNVSDLLRLLDTLHTSHTQSTKEPIIIQCIDGVAQSGAVCALWDVISRMTCDGEVDVYQAVRHVHTVRPEAVTSVVQYRFIYEVIQQYINSSNIYANT